MSPGRSIETFVGIDFIGLAGYPPSTPVTVEVLREDVVVGSARYTTLANGTLEIHHVGDTDCWAPPYTPDITGGDVIRTTVEGETTSDTSTVRHVFIDTENVVYTDDNPATPDPDASVTVTGHARSTAAAPIVPGTDVLEARMNIGSGTWSTTGRKDLREDVGAAVDASGNFTFTFPELTQDDITRARAGNEVMLEWSPAVGADETVLPPELSVWDGESGPLAGCPPYAPADLTAPTAPTNVGAADAGAGSLPDTRIVRVSWTAATDNEAVTGYVVYRDGVEIGRRTGTATTPPATSLLDDDVPVGTHTYTVEAHDATPNFSPMSTPASITVGSSTADTEAPAAPTNLAATVSGTSVALTWTAATDNVGVTSYQVLRGTTVVADAVTGTSFTDNDVAAGSHSYTVKARDAAGNLSAASNTATADVAPPADTQAPAAPTNLAATVSGTSVALTWTAATDNVGVTSYQVLRGTTVVADAVTGTSFTDNDVAAGSHSYTVKARDAAGNLSAASNTATADVAPPADTQAPAAPTNLAATVSGTSVALTWTAATDDVGVTSYQVLRGTTVVADAVTGTSFTDNDVAAGSHSYTVKARDAAGNLSAASNTATASVQAASSVPSAPTLGTLTAGNARVTVRWTAPTSDGGSAITGYTVRAYVGTETTVFSSTPAGSTATSVVVTGLTNGTGYSFDVVANNANGAGAPSVRSAVVTPATVPGAPTIGPATAGDASATVTWTAPASDGGSAITEYRVQVRTGTTVVRTVTGIAPTATSTVVTGLTNGTGYNFRVRAVNAKGAGNLSAASNTVTPTAGSTTSPPPGGDTSGGDTTAPTVTASTPASNGYGVAVGSNITVAFSETVRNVTTSTFTVKNTATGAVAGAGVSFNSTTGRWVLNPSSNLAPDTRYTVTLTGGPSGIEDLAGNDLVTRTFDFVSGPRPTLSGRSPLGGATGVSRTANITATFKEAVQGWSTTTVTIRPASGGSPLAATVTYDATSRTLTLDPSATLAANTKYRVTLTGGPLTGPGTNIRDMADNALATTSWTFTTGA